MVVSYCPSFKIISALLRVKETLVSFFTHFFIIMMHYSDTCVCSKIILVCNKLDDHDGVVYEWAWYNTCCLLTQHFHVLHSSFLCSIITIVTKSFNESHFMSLLTFSSGCIAFIMGKNSHKSSILKTLKESCSLKFHLTCRHTNAISCYVKIF